MFKALTFGAVFTKDRMQVMKYFRNFQPKIGMYILIQSKISKCNVSLENNWISYKAYLVVLLYKIFPILRLKSCELDWTLYGVYLHNGGRYVKTGFTLNLAK